MHLFCLRGAVCSCSGAKVLRFEKAISELLIFALFAGRVTLINRGTNTTLQHDPPPPHPFHPR